MIQNTEDRESAGEIRKRIQNAEDKRLGTKKRQYRTTDTGHRRQVIQRTQVTKDRKCRGHK